MGGGIHDGTEHWRTFDREGGAAMKQESVTLNYRPLRAGERYCPACGTDTLRREPDGTVYYVGHSEANCYRRQLSRVHAEAERYRQQYEALRAAVEGVAERIGEAADGTYKAWQNDARDYLQGRAHAMEHAERMVRRILSDACPYCSAPMEDDPGRYPSGGVDMAWTCGTWRMIDGVTFRSDGCGAREVADDAVAR